VRVDGTADSRTAQGAQHHGLGDDDVVAGLRTALQAWGQCLRGQRRHRLGSGKMAARQGAPPLSKSMTRRLRGGHNDGAGSGEVDDGTGSREIFSEKFWQSDSVSESLRGLGFINVVQQFIYRGTTVGTASVMSTGPLLLKITAAMGGCHHHSIANVIRISIASF
jgi:hypothetical protein